LENVNLEDGEVELRQMEAPGLRSCSMFGLGINGVWTFGYYYHSCYLLAVFSKTRWNAIKGSVRGGKAKCIIDISG